jgi:hypothetical protein
MKRAVLVVLACVLLVSGCSLGPREDWAKAMRGGFEKARTAGSASVRQSVAVKAIETNIRQQPTPLIARSAGVADFDARRALMVETAGRKAKAVFDDLVVYLQRSKSSVGATDKRWAKFDFEREPRVDLDDNDRRLSVGVGLISPVLALEFLDGVLTGSVREAGSGMKAGAMTTHYTARLAPDAAVTKIKDEDRKEGVTRLFATYGIQEDDFPVDVWVDADRNVRAVRYVLRQQKDRVNAFTMTLSWEFTDYGAKTDTVALPAVPSTIRSGRFSEFVEELVREF